MRRSNNASKLPRTKSGGVQKRQVGGNTNQKIFYGKYSLSKAEKVEDDGLAQKKVNYQAKFGMGKEPIFKNDEKIYQTKKKVQYLDNYQYHETKDIKNKDPNKASKVRHRRKGDIGGESFYEQKTFQQRRMSNPENGAKLYSSQTTKIAKKNAPAPVKPYRPPQRSNSVSRSLSNKRKEVSKYSTNLKNSRKKPSAKPSSLPTTKPSIKPSYKPAYKPTTTGANQTGNTTTDSTIKTTTTRTITKSTTKTGPKSNRSQSAGKGRRH